MKITEPEKNRIGGLHSMEKTNPGTMVINEGIPGRSTLLGIVNDGSLFDNIVMVSRSYR